MVHPNNRFNRVSSIPARAAQASLISAETHPMSVNLAPIRKNEVVIGRPLPWPIYNRSRKLLLRQGFVIESMSQIERLIEVGLFRPENALDTQARAALEVPAEHDDQANMALIMNTERYTPGLTIANAHFEVGLAIQLTSAMYPDDRTVVKLIGYLDKHSMMVSHPLKDGNVAFIKEGTTYSCRAFQKRNAYSFGTNVLKTQMAPYPYLHLTYPSSVRADPVRKASRLNVELIASAGPKARSARLTCVIRDLSLSGILIQSTAQLGEKDDLLSVAFRLNIDDTPTTFEINVVIRNNMTGDDDRNKGTYRAGCEFHEIDADLRRMLELYIYRELAQEG